MTERTAGPWFWTNDDSDESGDTYIVTDKQFNHICGDIYNYLDAQTIAASPLMLEALKEAREFIDSRLGETPSSSWRWVYAHDDAMILLARIDAVLKKAGG